jgi:hypothetical protein
MKIKILCEIKEKNYTFKLISIKYDKNLKNNK